LESDQAINGGGQNQARGIFTGALVGAQVGQQGISERFLDGLDNHEELLQLSSRVAILIRLKVTIVNNLLQN